MNDIEILEEFIKYFEAEATQRKYRRNISITVGEDDIEAIENLIQRNKDLEQILELMSKSLDNISYDQIPIAIEELKFKLQDLEQIEKEHKEENGRLREENINLKEKIIRQQEQLNIANKKMLAQKGQLKVVNNSYIPISKLKEKMELLREDIQYSANPLSIDNSKYAIEVLQELLEESD